MKFTNVKIEKFRSIKYAEFLLHNITAVVGENNAGKTAVLRAINSVLNYKYEEQDFINKRHQYKPRNNSHIYLTFVDIPYDSFFREYLYNDSVTIHFSYSYSDNRRKYEIIKGRDKISISDQFLTNLHKYITYVYIPAGRTNKDIRVSTDSITSELISNYVKQYISKKDMLSGKVKKVAENIHDAVYKKLEQDLNNLYMQNNSVDFYVNFPADLDFRVLLDSTQIWLNDGESKYLLQDWGSGTKSLAIIAMHRANAQLNSGSIVLGIEEPENHLHPQAQKRFIYSLKKKLKSNESQTIFTTHSTVLVDALEHEEILLVRRAKDVGREFSSKISQLPENFWDKYDLQPFKHYQFFHYRNSDFFFSKYVVLAESKNDCQVLEKIISDGVGEKLADVSFIGANGVEELKYPYFLLKELEIPSTIVVDRDYFFGYVNEDLDLSRNNSSGLPTYSAKLKSTPIIDNLFKTTIQKQKIVDAHKNGYRKFFEYISSYGILSMNYCLEMDLTCSKVAREKYYYLCRVPSDKKNQKYLLVNNKKSIKDISKIMEVLDCLNYQQYPESYKKIKNHLTKEIKYYITE